MSSPDNILSIKDKGDDIQNRFRYQNACACFISLNLLSDDKQFCELYCEHHEDILLKLNNGKFAGVQIKTKNLDLGPFDLNDEAVYKSYKRFVEHDIKFKNQFDYYVFATNVGLLKSESKGLIEYREWLKSTDIAEIKRSRKDFGKWTKALAKDLNVEIEIIIEALKKVRFKEALPHDGDIIDKISASVGNTDECKNSYFSIITSIVNKLIKLHDDASSLKINSDYIYLTEDPEEELVKEKIEKKRITKEKLLEVFTEELSMQTDSLIRVRNNSIIQSIPKTVKILEKKMDVGNITIDNINLIKDQKFAFEALITERFYKDKSQTEQDYNHLRQIILSESQISYDESYEDINAFGMKMLKDVRQRIHKRYLVDKDSFRGCQVEHLFGLIAILTEECKVWWSKKFDIDNYGSI
ncbi:MAG: dsDNA nuclease domain-containing protein [Paludibacter sp.]|nr:dsDNA nuclease domain-containing protein [Paludibacter sp.]